MSSHFHPLRTGALIVAVVAIVLPGVAARAADPVFPPGSRLGLVPPGEMVVSRSFEGFEDIDKKAAMLLSTLPAVAYDQIDKSMIPETMQKQGVAIDRREPVTLAAGKGFILFGKEMHGTAQFDKMLMVVPVNDLTALVTVQIPNQDPVYSEKAVRDAFATLAVRASVPDAERLSLLPFAVGDLAGFKIDDVLPGRALMLDDAADEPVEPGKDAAVEAHKARFLIAALPGGPAESEDRANFARVAFDQIAGLREVRIQDAEPLRIGNASGFQILAKAKDAGSDTDVTVVQWLRFGSGGFMQMIGIARTDAWPSVFNRMRSVRDGLDPR